MHSIAWHKAVEAVYVDHCLFQSNALERFGRAIVFDKSMFGMYESLFNASIYLFIYFLSFNCLSNISTCMLNNITLR